MQSSSPSACDQFFQGFDQFLHHMDVPLSIFNIAYAFVLIATSGVSTLLGWFLWINVCLAVLVGLRYIILHRKKPQEATRHKIRQIRTLSSNRRAKIKDNEEKENRKVTRQIQQTQLQLMQDVLKQQQRRRSPLQEIRELQRFG
jgi:apolipoprotein N-acyltransferase